MGCCTSTEKEVTESASNKPVKKVVDKKSNKTEGKAKKANEATNGNDENKNNNGVEKTWKLTEAQAKYKGNIIGPKGAHIKKVKEDSGADVNLEGVELTFDGTDAQVAKARELIKTILDEAENPDYAGEEGGKLREQAQKAYEEQHRLAEQSRKAYDAGDKGKAKGLSDQAKVSHKKAEELDAQAAKAIVKHRNAGKGDLYLDLHGLKMEEAMTELKQRLEKLKPKSGNNRDFEVIPGAGHHSKGKAAIKPAVESYLKEKGFSYEQKNAGSFIVHVDA